MLDAAAIGSWQALSNRLGEYLGRRVPAEDVDDLRQDVLLRIHRNVGGLDDRTRFGPWVYAIARNAVVDRLRRKPVPTTDLPDDVAGPLLDDTPDNPLIGCVTPFVARLPAAYRDAITLADLRGLSHREAAGVLGLSVSGVKSRVQRGRALMRAMFEECCRLTIDARGRVTDAESRSGRQRAPHDDGACRAC